MTNGDRIRSMSNRELAKSSYMTCDQCVYMRFIKVDDPWHCVKLGWDCTDGRTRWLEQEERKK